MDDQEFRTQDLALATVLRCEGIEPLRMELEGRTGFWIFPNGDPQMVELQREYKRREALVEPLKYNRVLRATRRQLFDFLKEHGIKPARHRS